MAIATARTLEPRMFNHRRGLWGYSGRTPSGLGLLVQATGMGGPSAAIVCEELVDLGAKTLLRVGTCGALDSGPRLGDLIVVTEVICTDGAGGELAKAGGSESSPGGESKAGARGPRSEGEPVAGGFGRSRDDESGGCGDGVRVPFESGGGDTSRTGSNPRWPTVPADRALVKALRGAAAATGRSAIEGIVASVDLFYDPDGERRDAELNGLGALAIEMEAAAVLAIGARRDVRAGCLLAVTDELGGGQDRRRLDDDAITALGDTLGEIAVAAIEGLVAGQRD